MQWIYENTENNTIKGRFIKNQSKNPKRNAKTTSKPTKKRFQQNIQLHMPRIILTAQPPVSRNPTSGCTICSATTSENAEFSLKNIPEPLRWN